MANQIILLCVSKTKNTYALLISCMMPYKMQRNPMYVYFQLQRNADAYDLTAVRKHLWKF